jgi:caffeoyl-CoA O-methyltransferase
MEPLLDERIEAYAADHSAEEPELLQRLAEETRRTMAQPQMLTGRTAGSFLRVLVRAANARRVLEVGTFTGYSALMMAAGLPEDGRLITCDVDEKAAAVARRYFAQSPHGGKIELRLGRAADTIRGLAGPFDLVFIDADKPNYGLYWDLCLERLRPGGVVVADNVLWSGQVLDPKDDNGRAIVAFNQQVRRDPRVDCALLTVRDGMMVAVARA